MHTHFLTNYMLTIRFLLFPCANGLLLLLLPTRLLVLQMHSAVRSSHAVFVLFFFFFFSFMKESYNHREHRARLVFCIVCSWCYSGCWNVSLNEIRLNLTRYQYEQLFVCRSVSAQMESLEMLHKTTEEIYPEQIMELYICSCIRSHCLFRILFIVFLFVCVLFVETSTKYTIRYAVM